MKYLPRPLPDRPRATRASPEPDPELKKRKKPAGHKTNRKPPLGDPLGHTSEELGNSINVIANFRHYKMAASCRRKTNFVFHIALLILMFLIRLGWGRVHKIQLKVWLSYKCGPYGVLFVFL